MAAGDVMRCPDVADPPLVLPGLEGRQVGLEIDQIMHLH